jgi:hypothetical protein
MNYAIIAKRRLDGDQDMVANTSGVSSGCCRGLAQ